MGNDWKTFFQLYANAPNLGQALIDLYVPRMRFLSLSNMARALGPSLPLSYLTATLGFKSPAKDAHVLLEPEAGGSGYVPPGCSSGVFKGRFVGLDSREEALQACMQWALACHALFDEQGGWPRLLYVHLLVIAVHCAAQCTVVSYVSAVALLLTNVQTG